LTQVSAAVDLISKRGEGGGQIVLISDGLCEVGERWLSRTLALKARHQVRILTVIVDRGPCSDKAPASFSDRIVRWSELVASPGSIGDQFVPVEHVATGMGGHRR
jgi:uncharacterized protein with von Willebrand factor type A (vWA) domain